MDNKKCPNMNLFSDREPDKNALISYSDRRGYHYVLICLEKVTGHHYLTKNKVPAYFCSFLQIIGSRCLDN
jgi:hypothetical protein